MHILPLLRSRVEGNWRPAMLSDFNGLHHLLLHELDEICYWLWGFYPTPGVFLLVCHAALVSRLRGCDPLDWLTVPSNAPMGALIGLRIEDGLALAVIVSRRYIEDARYCSTRRGTFEEPPQQEQ